MPSPGLCQAFSANTAIILCQVVGPPPEMTQPPPPPWGPQGPPSVVAASPQTALSWRRNCQDRPGRNSPRRSPKESEFSLAEPLRGSLHCPGPGRRFPGLAGQEHGRQQRRPQPCPVPRRPLSHGGQDGQARPGAPDAQPGIRVRGLTRGGLPPLGAALRSPGAPGGPRARGCLELGQQQPRQQRVSPSAIATAREPLGRHLLGTGAGATPGHVWPCAQLRASSRQWGRCRVKWRGGRRPASRP